MCAALLAKKVKLKKIDMYKTLQMSAIMALMVIARLLSLYSLYAKF
jgi:tartrate dehydratase beta subunit/fumarate hydratase class I family protein